MISHSTAQDHGLRGRYRVGFQGKYDLRLVGAVNTLVVEGAGGVGNQCNGLYRLDGSFNGKPMFKQDLAMAEKESIDFWTSKVKVSNITASGPLYLEIQPSILATLEVQASACSSILPLWF